MSLFVFELTAAIKYQVLIYRHVDRSGVRWHDHCVQSVLFAPIVAKTTPDNERSLDDWLLEEVNDGLRQNVRLILRHERA